MIITAHQPEHLVWLGFIRKAWQADIFVISDTVQYERKNVQNRNRIRTATGWSWLIVPVKRPLMRPISEIRISYDHDWIDPYLNLIKENYRKAPYFNHYFPILSDIISKRHSLLADLNLELIKYFLAEFGVSTKLVRASELVLPESSTPSNHLIDTCTAVGADTYLSGPMGRNYLDLPAFSARNIEVQFADFDHPSYPQQYQPLLPGMSCLDLLMNCGSEKAKEILFPTKAGLRNNFEVLKIPGN